MSNLPPPTPHESSETLTWFRTHPFLVALSAAFVVASMLLTPLVFPNSSLGLSMLAGAMFGMLCMLCATMHLFME